MQKINKKAFIISISAILVIIIAAVMLFFGTNVKNRVFHKYDYYYTFRYDDNLFTESINVYNKKGKIQEKYYVFYDGDLICLTKGQTAVLLKNKLDLKDEPELEIMFMGEETKHKMGIKK